MERRIINPWSWQDAQGWSWGIEVRDARSTLYCSGQVPTDASGRVLHAGDMRAQIGAALDNLETVLKSAGYALSDVVRIDYYATDVDAVMKHWDVVASRLVAAGCRAGGVLLGVTRLAHPDLAIEIQAIAAR
jgi:enamine deaminase RidA (YjgF/YER057c/UK114 family)